MRNISPRGQGYVIIVAPCETAACQLVPEMELTSGDADIGKLNMDAALLRIMPVKINDNDHRICPAVVCKLSGKMAVERNDIGVRSAQYMQIVV